jgi:hypothetical protein
MPARIPARRMHTVHNQARMRFLCLQSRARWKNRWALTLRFLEERLAPATCGIVEGKDRRVIGQATISLDKPDTCE